METKINKAIREVLEKFGGKYFIEGSVHKSKVIQDLDAYDKELLSELMNNETIKENFTIDINGNTVLQTNKLIELFEADEYWKDSYTKYSKKIGLTVNGKFIDESNDVVLDFPYKDTVLKASMSKEDIDEDDLRPDEPFLNEIIAKEEIDVLLDKKILVNAKKFTQDGVEEINHFHEDENLIIKGNNLLALHTIKEKYAGNIKLIYIDPPYNTGSDSFIYNDRFNLASWLVFMKNRIEASLDLLNDEGVMAVQISNHQYHYLKVLLDDIFEQAGGKHVMTFNVLVRHPDRILTGDKEYNDVIEYTLIYSKSDTYKMPKIEIPKEVDEYVYKVELLGPPDEIKVFDGKEVEVYFPERYKVTKHEGFREGLKIHSVRGSIREKNSSGRFYVKHIEPLINEYESETLFKVPDMGDDIFGYRFFALPKKGNKNGYYYQGMPQSSNVTLKPVPNFLDFHQEYNVVNDEGGYSYRNGKKPEKMLSYYIDLFTQKDDVVLDFFMGSGSTQSTALKMGRRFIGFEQMDHINEIAIPRLKNVINGEQSGISKEVNWQGGGSFVYVELMEKNRGFLKSIRDAKNQNELSEIFEFMLENADIDFRVDLEKVKDTLHELPLGDQKRTLIKMIDKNQLYYNYSEIDDENVRDLISDKDYAFNKSFYGESGE